MFTLPQNILLLKEIRVLEVIVNRYLFLLYKKFTAV